MKIGIIGIGLIGSSISLALQKAIDNIEIYICDIDQDHLNIAKQRKLGHHFSLDPKMLCESCDVIFICTPVGAIIEVAENIKSYVKPDTLICDVGSVKSSIAKKVHDFIPPHCDYIPCHPVAGTEHSGPNAGFAELFQNKSFIMCPFPNTKKSALETIKNLIAHFGAIVVEMDMDDHDRILAFTSHMVHIFAFSAMLQSEKINADFMHDIFDFAQGSFKDFTRVAASDVTMWRDIFHYNSAHVVEMANNVIKQAQDLISAIDSKDDQKIVDLVSKARKLKQHQHDKI